MSAETPAGSRAAPSAVSVVPRNWFNPSLDYQWFMVPNLIGSIALISRSRDTDSAVTTRPIMGTFEQLMVSPLRAHEILLGKLTPPMLIGLFHITLYVLAAVFLFGIPLRGSLLLRYGSAVFYLVLHERAHLSSEMALRIEKAFGVCMDTLMRMPNSFDIAKARKREGQNKVTPYKGKALGAEPGPIADRG